jgi:hypothetical protein
MRLAVSWENQCVFIAFKTVISGYKHMQNFVIPSLQFVFWISGIFLNLPWNLSEDKALILNMCVCVCVRLLNDSPEIDRN